MKKKNVKNNCVNIGGVNGIGDKIIDTNSNEFKKFKEVITLLSEQQTPEEKEYNRQLSNIFKIENILNERSLDDLC